MIKNTFLSKSFLKTLFWKQNGHHKHGVLIHTLRVSYYAFKAKDYRMVLSALLHDIGKPVTAYQKAEDIALGEYSFTDHEEMSYQMIKRWKFVSGYTKIMVRYHYLIRDRAKHKSKDATRYDEKTQIWNSLSPEIQEDLKRFLKYDDLAKGWINEYKKRKVKPDIKMANSMGGKP